jgi:hypothetical protein
MRDHCRAALQMSIVVAITLSLVACTGVGEDEQAFCDAAGRNDAAAVKALLDTGQIDMTAGGGKCAPALALFERASSRAPAFIPMAVAVAGQPGVAGVVPRDVPGGHRVSHAPSTSRRRTARRR